MALYALTKSQSDRIAKAVRAVEADVIPGQKWAKNIAASKGYAGQFAVAMKAGTTDTVVSLAGHVIWGATTNQYTIEHTPSGDEGTKYLYLEIYYTTSLQIGVASSATFPNQEVKNVDGTDYPCLRVLIATLTWSGTAVTAIVQQQYGSIHCAGRWV